MNSFKKRIHPELAGRFYSVWRLSVPAILTQITSIVMQYIDSAMVGRLGPDASAAIGLVASSTWLMNSFILGVSAGFSVQIAHQIGAGAYEQARKVLKHGLVSGLAVAALLLCTGVKLSGYLPYWLGGEGEIVADASSYFLIFALAYPFMLMNSLASACLQCSGNMVTPSVLNASMCVLDVIFNMVFIPRFGVMGAGIGTGLAGAVISLAMLWCCCVRSEELRLNWREPCPLDRKILGRALKIGLPVTGQEFAMCGAMVASTRIIAPLGTAAIAANSFAVTVEGLCYMPGYGIGNAATALVGRNIGAGKYKLAKQYGNISLFLGVLLMTVTGAFMWLACPQVFRMLTPSVHVQELAAEVLRVELLAEPLFAVSIVASGVLRGAEDTLVPGILNLLSIWVVRIGLSLLLVGRLGLHGMWIAMAAELCVRGTLLFIRQQSFWRKMAKQELPF
mgnify:CR=1 FL=1